MNKGPQAALLPDGRRLHLHHGPIDLIIEVVGAPRQAPYERAIARFEGLLGNLVQELPLLRRPFDGHRFSDPVARRMAAAVAPFSEQFVTPMAAVAGAVADEMLEALTAGETIPKAYVNNGGDIAFHLGPGQSATSLSPAGEICISADKPGRGMATSGWRGRSQSLGVADAVTVVARNAAAADVAATLIANAVDLPGHPAVRRRPASDLNPDSDLGDRLVTTNVGPLQPREIETALSRGLKAATAFRRRDLLQEAAALLQGRVVTTVSHQESVLSHG